MKGQQLFHSFLPGVTAAVLTTQPAWAGTVKVNGVQLASSPNVATSSYGQNLIADATKPQQLITASNSSAAVVRYPEWISLNIKPGTQNRVPLMRTKKLGLTRVQTPKKNENTFFSLTSTSYPIEVADRNLQEQSNQRQSNLVIVGQKSENINVSASPPNPASVERTTFSLSSSQPSVTQKNQSQIQRQTVLPTTVTGASAAKLLEPSCLQENISLLEFSKACLQKTGSEKLVAQNTPTTPGRVNPAPAAPVQIPTSPGSLSPTPTNPGQIPTTPGNISPASTAPVQIPDNLKQNPNPLLFPTKPEEVTVQGNQPISLAQALETAKRNNRDLQVARLQLERNRSVLREAQAALFPTVGISAEIDRARSASNTYSANLQGTTANSNTDFQGQAQLQYNLYTSGQRQASIRAAEEQVRVSELTVEQQSEEISLNVATDYYNLQQADEQVRINESAVKNAQASLRDAEALERAGVGTRFDVLRSQVNLANATQDLTNALSQQQIARRQIATRLNLPQLVNVTAADPVKLAGLWNQSLEQSIVLAFQNRPELQAQLAQRNISEQQRRQALASLGPQVSLVASYSLFDRFDDSVNISDGYSVGVRATLNLFDGGAARARAAQQQTNIAIAETNFANQRDQIRFQVEQAFSNQKSNLENVQTSNTALEQAREALRLARLRFQAGVGTQTDVINSENDLTRAEGNRVRAILDYNRALANLQRAVTSRAFR